MSLFTGLTALGVTRDFETRRCKHRRPSVLAAHGFSKLLSDNRNIQEAFEGALLASVIDARQDEAFTVRALSNC